MIANQRSDSGGGRSKSNYHQHRLLNLYHHQFIINITIISPIIFSIYISPLWWQKLIIVIFSIYIISINIIIIIVISIVIFSIYSIIIIGTIVIYNQGSETCVHIDTDQIEPNSQYEMMMRMMMMRWWWQYQCHSDSIKFPFNLLPEVWYIAFCKRDLQSKGI